MCICDHNLTGHKTVQLIKDFTTEHVCGTIEFYLNTNVEWSYTKLIEHLQTSFDSGKTFSSLLTDFYGWYQKLKETKDQFINELQVLVTEVISIGPEWKSQVDEALKTQFAHILWDQYFVAMAHNILKNRTAGHDFYQILDGMHSYIWDEVQETIKGHHSHKYNQDSGDWCWPASKVSKPTSQSKDETKDQSPERGPRAAKGRNLKSKSHKHAIWSPKMKEGMTQAMACMYNIHKGPTEKKLSALNLLGANPT